MRNSLLTWFMSLALLGWIMGCSADPSDTPQAVEPSPTEGGESNEDTETGPTDPDVEDGEGDANVEEDAEEIQDTETPSDTAVPDGETEPTDAGSGDGEDPEDVEEDGEESDGDDPDTEGPEEVVWQDCDAGDVAWAKRAIQAILGRNPKGINEAKALAAMVKETDRATVAFEMTRMSEYMGRWADFLMDELRVNRVGDKAMFECYTSTPQSGDGGDLAAHIRDNTPATSYPGGGFNMSDVLGSCLDLDDISPLYRAHLFAMMSKPITGANVGALEMDITRRQDFGENFSAIYTHRGVVCVSCHNSAWGVTDSSDPEEDRHWALPGLFEEAIYGANTGRDEMEVYSAFRHLGVVGGGSRPWNMDNGCGTFTAKENISVDPADIDAYLVSAIGKTGSIWDVEAALHQGFMGLAEDGLQLAPETMAVDPNEGFAYLIATRVVNQVWQELTGYPLTLVHYIPRNEEQRDLFLELTTQFVESKFSLKTLLVDIVTHPLFNQVAPRAGCGLNSPYVLPNVWNPWVLDEPDTTMTKNSSGDGVHRKSARTLLRSIQHAMDWPTNNTYPNGLDEEFHKAIGVFVKDAEPGFLGVDFQGMLSWESRYGACENQGSGFDWIVKLLDGMGDYQVINGEIPTLRQLVSALKDRMFSEPEVSDEEALLLAQFVGIESIDVPAIEVPDLQDNLRGLCGVFAEAPQFLLVGMAENMDNVTAPEVVVSNYTFETACEGLSETLFPGATIECGEEDVTIDSNDEE